MGPCWPFPPELRRPGRLPGGGTTILRNFNTAKFYGSTAPSDYARLPTEQWRKTKQLFSPLTRVCLCFGRFTYGTIQTPILVAPSVPQKNRPYYTYICAIVRAVWPMTVGRLLNLAGCHTNASTLGCLESQRNLTIQSTPTSKRHGNYVGLPRGTR